MRRDTIPEQRLRLDVERAREVVDDQQLRLADQRPNVLRGWVTTL